MGMYEKITLTLEIRDGIERDSVDDEDSTINRGSSNVEPSSSPESSRRNGFGIVFPWNANTKMTKTEQVETVDK